MRQSVDSAAERMNSDTGRQFCQILWRRTDDTMSHEESDFEPDAFPDRQPVKFIADGGRNAVELRNTQDQPSSGPHTSGVASITPFQSAYRQFHSTETALLRIQNDLLAIN